MTWKSDYITLRVRLVKDRSNGRITQELMAAMLGVSVRSIQRFEAAE